MTEIALQDCIYPIPGLFESLKNSDLGFVSNFVIRISNLPDKIYSIWHQANNINVLPIWDDLTYSSSPTREPINLTNWIGFTAAPLTLTPQ
jgi:hypothetical protein